MSLSVECSVYHPFTFLLNKSLYIFFSSFYGGSLGISSVTSTADPFLVVQLLAVPPDATIFYHLEEKFAEGHCQEIPGSPARLPSDFPVSICPTITHRVCLFMRQTRRSLVDPDKVAIHAQSLSPHLGTHTDYLSPCETVYPKLRRAQQINSTMCQS